MILNVLKHIKDSWFEKASGIGFSQTKPRWADDEKRESVHTMVENAISTGDVYERLKRVLEDLADLVNQGDGLLWLPPLCPECMQPLSQKFASDRLVCVVCGHEFVVTPLGEEG